jgi:hypothetical protein
MVVMGLDLDDPDNLDAFMPTISQTFVSQRMCSPPETSTMFITLMGGVTAEEFKVKWAKEIERDGILATFMKLMTEATVLHGLPDGTIISHISLI